MAYNPSSFQTKNSRDLNLLHPKVKNLAESFIVQANAFLANKGYQVKVISTLRNNKEQAEIYAQGRTKPGKIVTNAGPGKSVHNFGCAFDIGIFRDGIYNPPDADKYFDLIAPIGRTLGLEWGGDWKSIKDRPHYQYTGKYSNSEFLRLANNNVSIDEILK